MIKIGVLGAGKLGSIHLSLLNQLPQFELAGFYDPDESKTSETMNQYNIPTFYSVEDLIENVDAVDIVTPTLSHFDCAKKAIRNSKHVFIEKPITNTTDEARQLINLIHEAEVIGQVGHVERFNPAFLAAKPYLSESTFIDCKREIKLSPKGVELSVVLDLMIHDLDIVLSTVKSNVKRITAHGMASINDLPDIVNVRLDFDNGTVANLTASRIGTLDQRVTEFHSKHSSVYVDYLNQTTNITTLKEIIGVPSPNTMTIDPGVGRHLKEVNFISPEISKTNAINDELIEFGLSINKNQQPQVTIEDGLKALEVANQIIEKLNLSPSLFKG